MTLMYTVVPPEELWAEDQAEAIGPETMVQTTYHGIPVLARRTAQGAVLERLLTTDPSAYLRPDLTPGTPLDPSGKS